MALEYVDPIGGPIYIPGSYPSITVAPNNSGLATTGTLVLLGEADAGADYSSEEELNDNGFGPDQLADVIAKYKSGNLVDAFRAAANAAVDPAIAGAFTRAILVKTNVSTQASYQLLGQDGATDWADLTDKSYGALGNLIYFKNTATAEVEPSTGSVTWIQNVGTVSLALRVNGGAEVTTTLSAARTPAQAQAALHALSGIDCTGGADRSVIASTPSITIAVPGADLKVCTFTKSTAWDTAITAGDTLLIPAASALAGGGNENVGAWVVQSVVTNVLTAKKLSDGAKPGGVPGTVTNPLALGPIAGIVGADIAVYEPIVIKNTAAAVIPGYGKTLEIAETTSGTDLLSRCLYQLSATAVTWVSKTGSPKVINSSTEASVALEDNRQLDNVTETTTAGGELALHIGYSGTTCTVNITDTSMVLTAVGGSTPGTTTITLASYPTIADLASYINSLPSFTCTVGTAVLGNLPSSALDKSTWGGFSGTYSCATTWGAKTCAIKVDAYRFFNALASSALVMLNDGDADNRPLGGLPYAVTSYKYLAGGSKGGTTDAKITSAITALEGVRANFIVPLFSRDATDDIADGFTEASSSYTIDFINASLKSHVAKMSTMKARRNRQAFLSKRGTFSVVSEASANIASFRCAMTFEDFKVASSSAIVQYQPWMGAVLAASTQAAAFYQSLVRKQVNCSGVLQAAGDWSYNNDSQVENALKAGLLPCKKAEEGGFIWISDQTTYGKDSNSVYNSIQMVYAADTVALTTAQRMERAFVGKSIADVSASVALSYLDGIMADFLRLKLIAPSSDAPLGYKNANIVVQGPVMRISVEVKIAGSIYFIPISFYVTEITQTA